MNKGEHYEKGYENGLQVGWEEALRVVVKRAETYFPVDAASQRMVANLVAKVKEEGR